MPRIAVKLFLLNNKYTDIHNLFIDKSFTVYTNITWKFTLNTLFTSYIYVLCLLLYMYVPAKKLNFKDVIQEYTYKQNIENSIMIQKCYHISPYEKYGSLEFIYYNNLYHLWYLNLPITLCKLSYVLIDAITCCRSSMEKVIDVIDIVA